MFTQFIGTDASKGSAIVYPSCKMVALLEVRDGLDENPCNSRGREGCWTGVGLPAVNENYLCRIRQITENNDNDSGLQ